MNSDPHPIAKVFAPIVFASLALLTLGFSFGPAGAQEPEPTIVAQKIVSQ